MWPDNSFTERLGLKYPIIQAPMAGATTPEMVAAVCNAGGLGSLAAAMMAPDEIRDAIRQVKALTTRPFAVNLFALDQPTFSPDEVRRGQALFAAFRAELGLAEPPLPNRMMQSFDEQIEAILPESIPIFSFTFGIPAPHQVKRLKQAGMLLIGTATTPDEGVALEQAGIDFISAQGYEAGGHRGSFLKPFDESQYGTMALVPLLVDRLSIPVIAAGGIMDGRGIAAALMLGASAAQLGTAFLAATESIANPAHKAMLARASDVGTTITNVLTGRPVRGLRNRMIETLSPHRAEVPPYPLPLALGGSIYKKAREEGLTDYMPMWSGQAGAMAKNLSTTEIMHALARQAHAVFAKVKA